MNLPDYPEFRPLEQPHVTIVHGIVVHDSTVVQHKLRPRACVCVAQLWLFEQHREFIKYRFEKDTRL